MPLSQYILFFKPIGFFIFNLIVFFFGRYWKQLLYSLLIWIRLSRILFLRYLTSRFQGFDLKNDFWPSEIPFFRYSDDLKDFGVWPWPLTFRGHLGWKIFSPLESLYMTSYLTFIDTFSISYTVFEIFDFKVLRVWPWPLTFRGHVIQKNIFTIRKPIVHDFLSNFYWNVLSILYRFRDIRLQSFLGLSVWP